MYLCSNIIFLILHGMIIISMKPKFHLETVKNNNCMMNIKVIWTNIPICCPRLKDKCQITVACVVHIILQLLFRSILLFYHITYIFLFNSWHAFPLGSRSVESAVLCYVSCVDRGNILGSFLFYKMGVMPSYVFLWILEIAYVTTLLHFIEAVTHIRNKNFIW